MSDTPGRLLKLLSLLQTAREWPGTELALRLEVSPRTIRRDVDRLRDLGYPVEATMGPTGGYRLVAGSAMPPLLLDDEEAVAIAIGLRTAAAHAVEGIDEAAIRALAKLQQVLPARLAYRVGKVARATLAMSPLSVTTSVDPERLTVLAAAIGERLRFRYTFGDGTETARHVEPHRLVSAGHRWYLVAHDVERNGWRSFRVDRIDRPQRTGVRTAPREPPDGDAAAFVRRTLLTLAPTYQAEATLTASIDDLRRRYGTALGELLHIDDTHCRLRTHADTLEWLAFRLTALGCDFQLHGPPELITHLRALAARAARATQPQHLGTGGLVQGKPSPPGPWTLDQAVGSASQDCTPAISTRW